MGSSLPLIAGQPFKAIYSTGFVAVSAVRLALRAIYCIPRGNRPHRRWPLGACVGMAMWRMLLTLRTRIRSLTPYSHLASAEFAARFTLVPPAPQLPPGPPAAAAAQRAIEPSAVPLLWLSARRPDAAPLAGSRVLLHFHGGGYVALSPFDAMMRPAPAALAGHLAEACGEEVLAAMPQYRLASMRGGSGLYPAALQDALAAYAWVLAQGVDARRVVLSGDSAGAHLVLALLRWLREADAVPAPGAALLHHPWVDMARYARGNEWDPAWRDMLPAEFLRWGAEGLVGDGAGRLDVAGPYFSPARHPFDAGCPVWCQVGTCELFLEDVRGFVRGMRAAGNEVECVEIEGGMHGTFVGGGAVGFGDDAEAASRAAAAFVQRHTQP